MAAKSAQKYWISDTELASGKIPAVFSSDQELGIKLDVSTVVDMDEQSDVTATTQQVTATPGVPLTGSVSRTARGAKIVNLNNGSVVFAQSGDTIVNTPFGQVNIAYR